MPGEEPIVGMVMGSLAKTAADAGKPKGDGTSARLQEIAKDSPAMKVASEAHARRLAIRERALLKMWQPLARLVGLRQDYFDNTFPAELAAKLEDVPEENLIPPKAAVVFPAIQGLSYSLDEAGLKEMYLNLLAQSSDDRRSYLAHPAFAGVIQQLTPLEAEFLPQVLAGNWATARIWVKFFNGTKVLLIKNLLPYINEEHGFLRPEPFDLFVENWVRLGLVVVDYEQQLVEAGRYDWLDDHPSVVLAREQVAAANLEDGSELTHVVLEHGIVRPTRFGSHFRSAVMAQAEAEDPTKLLSQVRQNE